MPSFSSAAGGIVDWLIPAISVTDVLQNFLSDQYYRSDETQGIINQADGRYEASPRARFTLTFNPEVERV